MTSPGGSRGRWHRCSEGGRPIRATLGLFLSCAAILVASAASRTILLVDDGDVLYRSGTRRELLPFRRFKDNPVIAAREKPWEIAIGWMSVCRQPDTGLYQLWYQAFSGNRAKDPTRRCVVCYAESKDGVHFTKPDLNLFDYNGAPGGNIVLVANGGTSDRYGSSVIVDPNDPDPARRYKMAYYDFTKDDGQERPGLCVAFSPDGIHWTKHPQAPLLRAFYGNYEEPVPFTDEKGRPWSVPLSISDATDACFDPIRRVFAIYGKMWIDGPRGGMGWKHGMGRTESTDFIHWSPPQLLLTPDDQDAPELEFHTAPVFWHAGRYFALLQDLNRGKGGGVIDIELGVSQDGLRWERPFRKPFVLARSEGRQFDSGSILTCSTPVILENEIRFYYGGYSGGATGDDDYSLTSGVGFATIRRDRFAGVRAEERSAQSSLRKPLEHVGQITLKPVDLGAFHRLTLNADASTGSGRVELLDEGGRRIRGFSKDECVEITGDSLRHKVGWAGQPDGTLPPGRVMVRVHLQHASLFAVTFE